MRASKSLVAGIASIGLLSGASNAGELDDLIPRDFYDGDIPLYRLDTREYVSDDIPSDFRISHDFRFGPKLNMRETNPYFVSRNGTFFRMSLDDMAHTPLGDYRVGLFSEIGGQVGTIQSFDPVLDSGFYVYNGRFNFNFFTRTTREGDPRFSAEVNMRFEDIPFNQSSFSTYIESLSSW